MAEAWPDRLKLASLLRNGQFAELDDRLSQYQEAFEASELSDELVEHAFLAFSNSDPSLRTGLDAWNEAFPDSYAAPLARAVYNINLGWLARGVRYGRETPGERFSAMGDSFRAALPDLERAIRRNPKLSTGYGFLIQISMAVGADGAERRTLDAAIEAVPHTYIARFRYLYSLFPWWGGSLGRMQEFLDEVVGLEERVPRLANLRGLRDFAVADRLRRAGDHVKALAHYDSAIAKGDHWIIEREKGNALHKLGRYEAAVAAFTRAIVLHPQHESILDDRAESFRRLKRYKDALADWDLALRLDPFDPHMLRNRSYAYSDKKMYQEAINDLTKALVLGDHDAAVHHRLGYLYAKRLDDRATGLAELEQAVKLVPRNARYLYTYIGVLFDAWDCRVVEASRSYVGLCEQGANCPAENLKWVRELLEHVRGHQRCPTN